MPLPRFPLTGLMTALLQVMTRSAIQTLPGADHRIARGKSPACDASTLTRVAG